MAINKRMLAIALILVAILLSSFRVLDDYADDYTSDAIAAAAISYAGARAINALVSMLQSSSIEAGIGIVSGSVTVGELLDPVNDLVERFSAIMTLVLASLAAQKILLLIASHQLFLVLIAVFGLASIAVIQQRRSGALGAVVRVFLVLVFVRFALGLAVALNSGVDLLFLEQETRENDHRMQAFRQNLLNLGQPDAVSAADLARVQTRREALTAELAAAQQRLAGHRDERKPLLDSRDDAQRRLAEARDRAGLVNFFDPEVVAARDALAAHDELLERLDDRIAAEDRAIERIGAEIAALERNLEGAPADLFDRIRGGSVGFWRQLDIDELERKITEAIRGFMNLIALYLLKTVVFPLLFFGACYAVVRNLWALRW